MAHKRNESAAQIVLIGIAELGRRGFGSPARIKHLVDDGTIPPPKVVKGRAIWSESDLICWFRAQPVLSTWDQVEVAR